MNGRVNARGGLGATPLPQVCVIMDESQVNRTGFVWPLFRTDPAGSGPDPRGSHPFRPTSRTKQPDSATPRGGKTRGVSAPGVAGPGTEQPDYLAGERFWTGPRTA